MAQKLTKKQTKDIQKQINKIQAGINQVAKERNVTLKKTSGGGYTAVPNAKDESIIGAGPFAGMTAAEAEASGVAPSTKEYPSVTRNPGESLESYQDRILNSTYTFGGGSAASTNWGGLPFDITQVQSSSQLNLPQSAPGASGAGVNGVNGLSAYADAMFKTEDAQLDEERRLREERARLDAEAAKQKKPIWDMIAKAPSQQQVRNTAAESIGLSQRQSEERAAFAQLNAMNTDYSKMVSERDAQIAKVGDRLGSMNVLNNMTDQINRRYQPELNRMATDINAQAAVLAYRQQKVTEAEKFINQAVDAATQDKKDAYDKLTFIREENKDLFSRLDKDIQNAYNERINEADREYENAKYNTRFAIEQSVRYPQANIKPDDTPEVVAEKIRRNPITVETLNDRYGKSEGTPTPGFASSKIESSVREDVVSLLADVDAGTTTTEKAYNKARKLYSKSEVSDAALKDLFDMTQQEVQNQTMTQQTKTNTQPRTLKNDMVRAGDFLIEDYGGAVNSVVDSIANYLFK